MPRARLTDEQRCLSKEARRGETRAGSGSSEAPASPNTSCCGLTVLYVAGHAAARAGDPQADDTWRDILAAMVPLLIIAAIGQAFVLIVAGIDLSATSILAMSSVSAPS